MATAVQEANTVKFQQHLAQSGEAVWTVARWLHGTGWYVIVCPVSVTPNYDERMKHADAGDLYVKRERAGKAERVEVKRRGVHFTCAEDFPYDDFFVCACHAWDNATPKPSVFVILNADMTHAGIVEACTHRHWTATMRFDSRYQEYRQNFYTAPLDKVEFVPLL